MNYKIVSEKTLPESELQIIAEVPFETLRTYREKALTHIASHIDIAGFRSGHVPPKIALQKVGEFAVLEEAAEAAVREALPEIIKEKKLRLVSEPRVSITKLADNNPLQFNITLSVLGEVKLPDYKAIASAENKKPTEDAIVTDKELEDFLLEIRKSLGGGGKENNETAGSKDGTLPEFSDELVKKLGDFKDVTDFKNKVRENLHADKTIRAREKKRLRLAEAVMNKSDFITPKAVTESELAKMMARFHDDAARSGLKTEEYLKQIKKSEEELRKELRPEAEKRGRLQIIISHIAEAEKINAPKEIVEVEMKHFLEHYKDADPERVRAYVTQMIENEKVFEFLENQHATGK